MTYLVDTDWVASALKGRSEATTLLGALSSEGLAISLITYGEIYDGIYHGISPASQEAGFLAFLQNVDVVPLDLDIMRRFARLRGELRGAGKPISDFDLLIAATALRNNFTLVTRNLRHFKRIPSLSIYQAQ